MKTSIKKACLLSALIAGLGLILPDYGEAQTLTSLHDFTATSGSSSTNSDGATPEAGLILSGNSLYGTTSSGGTNGEGTVFAVNTDGTGFTTLHSFTECVGAYHTNSDGASPLAGLILVGNTLYGTTSSGGTNGGGTVFAVYADGTGFTTLHNFTEAVATGVSGIGYVNIDGNNPEAGLILSGNTLYGTANYGGSSGWGTVFAVNTDGTSFTTLHNFTAEAYDSSIEMYTNSDGGNPSAGLILSGGTLYGTAYIGGTYGHGTVFAVNTNGTVFTTLHDFNPNSDGSDPVAGLILSGNTLYGTDGTAFEIHIDGSGFTNLGVGAGPGGLILSGTTLYGTTQFGGISGSGSVFQVNTDGTGFKTVYTFTNGTDGARPQAGLILSGNTLYGTAAYGGANGSGSVFALILPATTPVLTWTNPSPIAYGTPLSSIQLNATANVPGTFVYKPTNGTVLNAGTNTLSVIFMPTDTVDYTSVTDTVSIVVLKAAPAVTWSPPSTITYGTPLSSVQLDATANVPGSFTYNPPSGSVLNVDTNTLSAVFTPTDTVDYSSATNTVSIVVLQATPEVSWDPLHSITYGTAISSNELNATANIPGSFSYNVTNGEVLDALRYPVEAFFLFAYFTPTDEVDYSNVTDIVPFFIIPAPLTVTASNASRAYGETNPVFTGVIAGLTNGDNITATYSCSATVNSSVGTYSIVPNLADPNDRLPNYNVTTNNGTLTVTTPSTQFIYITNAGTITITGYTGPGGGVFIPPSITGLPVTTIAVEAFYKQTGLTSVTIPGSVTEILSPAVKSLSLGLGPPIYRYPGAFEDCTGLTNITIANGVESIGAIAFEGCTSLIGVTIPSSVTSIGVEAFAGCTSLTSFTIPDNFTGGLGFTFIGCTGLTNVAIGNSVASISAATFLNCTSLTAIAVNIDNSAYSSVAGVLFNQSQTTLIAYPAGNVATSYMIPDSVTSIAGDGTFSYCSSLTNVTIPESVTNIGEYAFYYCPALTSVTIPSSVTSLGEYAFYGSSLTNIMISSGITSIGEDAFYYCPNLTSVTIPASVTNIGMDAFAYCTNLTSVYFEGDAPTVGSEAFYDDNNATVYYLSGTTGWSDPFAGQPATEVAVQTLYTYTTNVDGFSVTITGYTGSGGAVTIPATINFMPVTSIGNGQTPVFSSSLTSVVIPGSVNSIGDKTFFLCYNLTSVTLSNGINSIEDDAFFDCWSLTNVTIPASVSNIGVSAFGVCSSLIGITVAANNPSFSSVDGVLFDESQTTLIQYPGGLGGSYIIPNSVNGIGEDAFLSAALTSVVIPGSVNSISANLAGQRPFYGCSSLTAITVAANNPSFSSVDGVLFDKSQTTLIQYPGGLGGSYIIPDSVNSIGSYAFSSSFSLISVTIPGNVNSIGFWAFAQCSSLASVTISNGVKSIADSAFTSCYDLTSVTIPSSVTNIGANAFAFCQSLTNVCFGGSAPTDGGSIFENDPVSTIYYVNGTTGWEATYDGIPAAPCTECGGSQPLTIIWNNPSPITYGVPLSSSQLNASANLPGSFAYNPVVGTVLSVGTQTLSVIFTPTDTVDYSSATDTVTLTVTTPSTQFIYITNAGAITITGYTGSSGAVAVPPTINGLPVTSIGSGRPNGDNFNDFVFMASSLTNIIIPNSVTNIAEYAFYSCQTLTNITIPESVTSIGFQAFGFCANMTAIMVDAQNAFYSSVNGALCNHYRLDISS